MTRAGRLWICIVVLGLFTATGVIYLQSWLADHRDRYGGRTHYELIQIGHAYRAGCMAGKPPGRLEDLKSHLAPGIYAQVENGRYTVIWNVPVKSWQEPEGRFVLGYHREVPERGGVVLLGNTRTQEVSAEEFASMPKGQPSVPAETK